MFKVRDGLSSGHVKSWILPAPPMIWLPKLPISIALPILRPRENWRQNDSRLLPDRKADPAAVTARINPTLAETIHPAQPQHEVRMIDRAIDR
ncbi:hypothetical protein [uncultured Sphingomonas sp.]|uniref:hypothetical protein n=1 Tax=uncultured Sphingomonas sp. TaxID=158754 RepID=UPI0026060647|nr:hypothetical protein [uncultured Sphingomonas sp.]